MNNIQVVLALVLIGVLLALAGGVPPGLVIIDNTVCASCAMTGPAQCELLDVAGWIIRGGDVCAAPVGHKYNQVYYPVPPIGTYDTCKVSGISDTTNSRIYAEVPFDGRSCSVGPADFGIDKDELRSVKIEFTKTSETSIDDAYTDDDQSTPPIPYPGDEGNDFTPNEPPPSPLNVFEMIINWFKNLFGGLI